MANLYAGLETTKRAAGISGSEKDAVLLRLLEAASRRIDLETRRRFIPLTATRFYDWPQEIGGSSVILWLHDDLLACIALLIKAQDASPTTVPSTDYFLEPQRYGPPYNRIEIDLSSAVAFEAGDTPQRSVSVAGRWGYSEDTKVAGTLAAAIASAIVTSATVSDASLVDVGDTLLIGSEQICISARAATDTTTNTSGTLNADKSQTAVTVTNGALVLAGEVILINSERMYVESVVGNNLTVIRAYDGSVLATHADVQDVYAYRTLTIVRGVNGTTAASHNSAAAISKYVAPYDIIELCIAEAIAAYHQEQGGWGRTVGMGEGAREPSGQTLADLRRRIIGGYRRMRMAPV